MLVNSKAHHVYLFHPVLFQNKRAFVCRSTGCEYIIEKNTGFWQGQCCLSHTDLSFQVDEPLIVRKCLLCSGTLSHESAYPLDTVPAAQYPAYGLNLIIPPLPHRSPSSWYWYDGEPWILCMTDQCSMSRKERSTFDPAIELVLPNELLYPSFVEKTASVFFKCEASLPAAHAGLYLRA